MTWTGYPPAPGHRLPLLGHRLPVPRRRLPAPRGTDRGSGTVLMVAVVAVVLMTSVAGLALGSAVVAAHRARAAADLAALAGATGLARGQDSSGACATAASVAGRNGAVLTACGEAADGTVLLRARAAVAFGLPGLPRSAHALARAGPTA